MKERIWDSAARSNDKGVKIDFSGIFRLFLHKMIKPLDFVV